MDNNNITSIAIGGFDGMHFAHQALFSKLDKNGAIIVIETQYSNLTPKRYREEYTSYPIHYYQLDTIKSLNGKQFISLLQKNYPNLQKIIVGYDFHFGNNRKYSTTDLKELFNGIIEIVKEIFIDNISVHSGIIRDNLKNGKIQEANKLLNKPYSIICNQITGQGLGSKQFVPTINLNCNDFLIPESGIYATKTIINQIDYDSVTFIGHRLTTDNKFAIETHIIDTFNDNSDLTLKDSVKINFFKKIRDNKKFKNYELLKQQILNDIQTVKSYLITIT